MAGQTLYDKVWAAHLVGERKDGNSLIYIDLQLLHEVTSPQAFEGLTLNSRPLWRVDANLATPDHNVPTEKRELGFAGITDEIALEQVVTLDKNCKAFGLNSSRSRSQAGYCACSWARAGRHDARHDHCLWRLSYLDPWRLRISCSGRGHLRSRTRDGYQCLVQNKTKNFCAS